MIPVPACKCPGCLAPLNKWSKYVRTAVRGTDGKRLQPIPIARFTCPLGHGTTSWLPAFLHRYLHYAAPVVEGVLEAGCSGTEAVEVDGPSAETLQRWVCQLLAVALAEWLFRRLPGDRIPHSMELSPIWPERALTWAAAKAFAEHLRLDQPFFSVILQRARLALMKRYASWLP